MVSSISLSRVPSQGVPAVVAGDLTLVRPHGMAGIGTVLVTRDPDDVALRSRYVKGSVIVPGFGARDEEETVRLLLTAGAELHRRFGRKVPFAYGSDEQLEMLYRVGDRLSEHYAFTLNAREIAWAMHDKELFSAVAEAAGIRVPRTRIPDDGPDHGLSDLDGPVLVKPRKKTAWAAIQRSLLGGVGKARVFVSRHELVMHPAFATHKGAIIVQDYVEGGPEALVSFHGFADDSGCILASFSGRKLRTWPRVGGESSFIELTLDPAVRRVGTDVVRRLGLKGPFKVDMIRSERSGELYVLEINARYTLWHYLGAVHGVNLPEVAYRYLVDGRPGQPTAAPYQPRVRWVDFYRDYKAFREESAAGTLGLGAWIASLARQRVVYETFSWTDPLPASQWFKSFVAERGQRAVRDRLGHSR